MRCLRWNKLLGGGMLLLWLLAGTIGLQAQEVQRYQVYISFPKGGISGICLMRTTGEGGVLSLVNEFGIKAFDAVYSAEKDKVKLSNLIGPLNKWYRRKILAKDLTLLFNPEKPKRRRTLTRQADGTLVLENKRFKITYELKPIDNVTE